MSHRLEGVLSLARAYQLPHWAYSALPQLDPYALASLGFRPASRGAIHCYICQRKVVLSEQLLGEPGRLEAALREHEENCIYFKEEPAPISREELYLNMDDMLAEMDLSKTQPVSFPLLDSKSLLAFAGPNAYLLRKVLSLYDMSLLDFKISFLLRIFGWHFSKLEDGADALHCYFCGRTCPLAKLPTAAGDRQQEEGEGGFNPAGEHRYFCLTVGRMEGWLLLLQHHEDKFAEACSFKSKPLESERMRLRIDKFIDSAKEKIEGGLAKLRTLTRQCGLLCEQLGEDKILALEGEEQEGELKRLRDHEHSLQLLAENIAKELNHPLKKIRFN